MWKGRRLFFYSLAFIAGDLFGGWLTLPPALFLTMAAFCAIMGLTTKNRIITLITLFLLGAATLQISRIPTLSGESAIGHAAGSIKAEFSASLGKILSEGEELAIVRALTIGDKSDINRELRENYRKKRCHAPSCTLRSSCRYHL